MTRLLRAVPFALLLLLLAAGFAVAQEGQAGDPNTIGAGQERSDKLSDEEAAALAGASCLCFAVIALITVVSLAIKVLILIFVYKDATNRGEKNAIVWLIVVFFLDLIGLVIWLIARPAGNVIPCQACARKRLDVLASCPHCGAPRA